MTDSTNQGSPASAGFSGFSGMVWAVAGTPVTEPYPCRCHERKGKTCSAAWCPCAGRIDVLPEPCCSGRLGPAEHVAAMRAWREEQVRKRAVS